MVEVSLKQKAGVASLLRDNHNESSIKFEQKEIFSVFIWGPIVNLTYNHFHNILRLFDVLPNFPVTLSETMREYYLQK